MGLKENIKRYRLQNNLTMQDVANALGISKPTVQRYESGVIPNIPPDKISKLAQLFQVTPSDLLCPDDSEKASDDLRHFEMFKAYLNSIGYTVSVEKTGESKEGHYEEQVSDSKIVGQSWIPNTEEHSVFLQKDGVVTEFNQTEFEQFQESICKSIEYEVFKQNKK